LKHLILFRHAKAERKADSGDDFDRELTKRGLKDAELMGQVLARAGYKPDAAIVSSARRTRETWEHAAIPFKGVATAYSRRLYEATPRALMEAAETELKRANCVVVVAHNPGVQELAVGLLKAGGASAADVARARSEFPTAGMAALTVDDDGGLSAARLLFPADHGGKGGD
jgi:phosphohistidine phosphatase